MRIIGSPESNAASDYESKFYGGGVSIQMLGDAFLAGIEWSRQHKCDDEVHVWVDKKKLCQCGAESQ